MTTKTKTRNRVLAGVLGTAVVAIVAVLAAGSAGGKAEEAAAKETPIVLSPADVAVVEKDSVRLGVELTGTLNPHRIVEVRAQVPGIVTGMQVDRGVAVREGEVLAAIEAEGIRSEVPGAQAAVAAAESNLAVARREAESARRLYEAGAMSELEHHTAQASFKAAEAQLAAARAQAAAAVEAARHATIVSPLTGEVSDRQVSEGEAVSPGQALFTVVNTDVLELAGRIPVESAAGIRPGLPVAFTLDAYPGARFQGTVARVEPTADPTTRQVGVYVQLPNRERELMGGLFATGRILTGREEEAVVVPMAAVRGDSGNTFVWLIREDASVARREVELGLRDETRGVVQVIEGLAGGERLIAAPGEITEGAHVRVAVQAERLDGPAPAGADAEPTEASMPREAEGQ